METADTAFKDYWVGTTWTGVGEQENPDSEWPITVTFTGGRPGEVVGTVEYPTLGCGGELVLTSIIPDEYGTFEATEHITYGQNNCIDGGSFWFSSAEGAPRLLFSWESPAGPTIAEGILDPVESGTASASSSTEAAERDDIDFFIGTWQGTGTQSNRSNSWPITFTFSGGLEGEVVGTVDYPTLECGGDLILIRNARSGIVPMIELTEHITYGESNCIDGGNFTLHLAEGGAVPAFRWVSPDGKITAKGPIERVEPGTTSASVDPSTEASGASQEIAPPEEIPPTEEPVETDASGGGPPSIYEAPASEGIVPIEPEGEGD